MRPNAPLTGRFQLWILSGLVFIAISTRPIQILDAAPSILIPAWLLVVVTTGWLATTGRVRFIPAVCVVTISLVLSAIGLLRAASPPTDVSFWATFLSVWLGSWMLVAWISELQPKPTVAQSAMRLAIPLIFGLTLIWIWEVIVHAANVPRVILPPPSAILNRIADSGSLLWLDFVQTVVKGALPGFAIGCLSALTFAVIVDRSAFLRAGLLPVGNFISALPIIGIAPIMVMWFGFDWHSKAAVVVAMVFFPMLINTVQGLSAVDPMQRDLMRTWSASYWQSLRHLKLPAAMPFIFNGLKICSTLSLIGAIVAEFFGSPTRGMGFRISTEVGRLQLDMVWAEITMAAVAGSAFFGFWALLERWITFWHPSQRAQM